MTKRSFDDAFWGDPFVQTLDKEAKLLFLYLWTNKRCNSAGLYEITTKTISFETSIDNNQIPPLFDILKPKVKWLPENNVVWVINFLKHQPKSPLFLRSVSDCLCAVSCNGLVNEFREYYRLLGVNIPFPNPMNTHTNRYGNILEPEQEQEQEQEYKERGVGEGKTKYPKEFNEPRKLVFEGLKTRRGYSSRNASAEAKAISEMLNENFTPVQILEAYDRIKAQPFYADKFLSTMQVYKNIHEVLKNAEVGQSFGKVRAITKKYTTPEEWRNQPSTS